MIQKNSYYINFDTVQFLGGKELLKSMPTFFNRVYFCKKYGNALWTGEKEETFPNISMICKREDINLLRQIIRNNFLYIQDWDSIKFTEKADYGFSFIAGNIKYILMPYGEEDDGYQIRYYDSDTGMCYETHIVSDKKFFLDTSINAEGEFVRICDFNIENINDTNSKKFMAEKKANPEMAVYNSNRGYALVNINLSLIILALCVLVVVVAYYYIKFILS